VGDTVKDCDRIGLSIPYDESVRKDLVELEFNRKIIGEQKRLIDLKDLAIQTSQEQSNLWKEEAISQRKSSSTNFYLGVAGGIVIVLASAWALGQVSNVVK
jgi:hypothetical protein